MRLNIYICFLFDFKKYFYFLRTLVALNTKNNLFYLLTTVSLIQGASIIQTLRWAGAKVLKHKNTFKCLN